MIPEVYKEPCNNYYDITNAQRTASRVVYDTNNKSNIFTANNLGNTEDKYI